MKVIYKSKLGPELIIPIALMLGGAISMLLFNHLWIGALFMGILILGIGYTFLQTSYTIENDQLTIKCGFLYHLQIEISSIKQITATNSLFSSPAIALDRLEIKYNKFDSVLISPKEKIAFIAHLKKLEPTISVNLEK